MSMHRRAYRRKQHDSWISVLEEVIICCRTEETIKHPLVGIYEGAGLVVMYGSRDGVAPLFGLNQARVERLDVLQYFSEQY
jgi:hypothetical protein